MRRGLGRAGEVVARLGRGASFLKQAAWTRLCQDLLQFRELDHRTPMVDGRAQAEAKLDPAHVVRDSRGGFVFR